MPTSTPSLTHLLPLTAPQPSQTSRLRTPTTNAVPLLASPFAKLYSRIHTGLVLSYLFLRFKALVAEPLETMIFDLVVVGVMQGVFCGVCLPNSGNWVATTSPGEVLAGSGERPEKGTKPKTGGTGVMTSSGTASLRKRPAGLGRGSGGADLPWQSRVLPAVFSMILALSLPPIPLTIIALVMGAPLWPYSLLPLTLLFSFHVSILAVLPIFYTHGISNLAWRDVLAAWLPFDEAGVWGGFVGAFTGGWIGAIPMALDWDREWQKWPVTVLTAAYLGWAVGRLLTTEVGLGVGKRINFSESDGAELDGQAAAVATSKDGKKADVRLRDSKS